jgi:hypothetical protein
LTVPVHFTISGLKQKTTQQPQTPGFEFVRCSMIANEEKLAIRFVNLLAERADWSGQRVPHWANLSGDWRWIMAETISDFLAELGISASGGINEDGEDDHIREMCERMTPRQRFKMYRQLYALGCRITGVDQAIGRLADNTARR